MPRSEPTSTLRPSLLDRLIDLDPRNTSEAGAERAGGVAPLKASVKRDLEWLLNSKQIVTAIPPGRSELSRSLLTYGLPDFSHCSLAKSDDVRELQRAVAEAIGRFEPRLRDVSVVLLDTARGELNLRFRIDAILLADPTPEAISFDSELRMADKAFVVQGG